MLESKHACMVIANELSGVYHKKNESNKSEHNRSMKRSKLAVSIFYDNSAVKLE